MESTTSGVTPVVVDNDFTILTQLINNAVTTPDTYPTPPPTLPQAPRGQQRPRKEIQVSAGYSPPNPTNIPLTARWDQKPSPEPQQGVKGGMDSPSFKHRTHPRPGQCSPIRGQSTTSTLPPLWPPNLRHPSFHPPRATTPIKSTTRPKPPRNPKPTHDLTLPTRLEAQQGTSPNRLSEPTAPPNPAIHTLPPSCHPLASSPLHWPFNQLPHGQRDATQGKACHHPCACVDHQRPHLPRQPFPGIRWFVCKVSCLLALPCLALPCLALPCLALPGPLTDRRSLLVGRLLLRGGCGGWMRQDEVCG